jgi:hypothetical protein
MELDIKKDNTRDRLNILDLKICDNNSIFSSCQQQRNSNIFEIESPLLKNEDILPNCFLRTQSTLCSQNTAFS